MLVLEPQNFKRSNINGFHTESAQRVAAIPVWLLGLASYAWGQILLS